MLEVIEKLLILQDRDRKLLRIKSELARIDPERHQFRTKEAQTQTALDAGKQRVKQLESDRKKLELDVEAKKQLIDKYSNQQLLTRKNEEYRALSHEIETCKADITKIEDQELELMEQAEAAQKEVARATQAAQEVKKLVDGQVSQLSTREESLKNELAQVEAEREQLAEGIDETGRNRYERLLKQRGATVVVGVQHGVCGGCHMKLPAQVLLSCQQQQEMVTCINCGRILYYTRDMALVAAE